MSNLREVSSTVYEEVQDLGEFIDDYNEDIGAQIDDFLDTDIEPEESSELSEKDKFLIDFSEENGTDSLSIMLDEMLIYREASQHLEVMLKASERVHAATRSELKDALKYIEDQQSEIEELRYYKNLVTEED